MEVLSSLEVGESLAHYGVLGMKWGVRHDRQARYGSKLRKNKRGIYKRDTYSNHLVTRSIQKGVDAAKKAKVDDFNKKAMASTLIELDGIISNSKNSKNKAILQSIRDGIVKERDAATERGTKLTDEDKDVRGIKFNNFKLGIHNGIANAASKAFYESDLGKSYKTKDTSGDQIKSIKDAYQSKCNYYDIPESTRNKIYNDYAKQSASAWQKYETVSKNTPKTESEYISVYNARYELEQIESMYIDSQARH